MLTSLCIAFATYSRIPTPRVAWDEKNLRWAICFFPLIGAVIGGLLLLFSLRKDHSDPFLLIVRFDDPKMEDKITKIAEKSVRRLEGVSDVSVSLLTNSMEVQFDPAAVTADQICRAVASGGYSAAPREAAAPGKAAKAERPDPGAELAAMRNRWVFFSPSPTAHRHTVR